MKHKEVYLFFLLFIKYVLCDDHELEEYFNRTDPATCQLYQFKKEHPKPLGILTTSAGKLVEIRESISLNSDSFSNQYLIDLLTHVDAERIPERLVHAKGTAAFGYFEVTNDVSQYTKAEVFNGVGKKTPIVARLSTSAQNQGGSDVSREVKGLAVKFYTKEGNLDLLSLNFPIFFTKDPIGFPHFIHAFKRNPRTNLFDFSAQWDLTTKRPDLLHGFLWALSDYGIPNGYRKMDAFPIHVYEINNKNGDKYFVKFNFRSQQGIENLATSEAQRVGARDPDYYTRDLYNAIEEKNFPVWNLEMDVMTVEKIKQLDYNPFDVTSFWKKGTYFTVPIGRLVLDKNPDNLFRVSEQSAFNPGNLVPGIPGPADSVFKTRIFSYRDTQDHRLGVNHNRIEVNTPLYWKVYDRDGKPPVRDNMKDTPNYYPNSFNGPVPYVDANRPKEKFKVYDINAIDLNEPAYFYNHYLRNDQRARLIENIVQTLLPISPHLQKRAIRLLALTDANLGKEVLETLEETLKMPPTPPPNVLKAPRLKHKKE